MRFPNKEVVEKVRKEYPVGTRVELVKMDDEQAPPIGTKGTVVGVDDTASILVNWDNGSGLNVVYGEDFCRKLDAVNICKEGTIGIPKKDGGYKTVHYWIKVYEEGSLFGINNGKISKLMFKLDEEVIANYDRGWDIEPTSEEANLALCILLNEHN